MKAATPPERMSDSAILRCCGWGCLALVYVSAAQGSEPKMLTASVMWAIFLCSSRIVKALGK